MKKNKCTCPMETILIKGCPSAKGKECPTFKAEQKELEALDDLFIGLPEYDHLGNPINTTSTYGNWSVHAAYDDPDDIQTKKIKDTNPFAYAWDEDTEEFDLAEIQKQFNKALDALDE